MKNESQCPLILGSTRMLILSVCILLRVWDPGDGEFILSTQRYYRMLFFTIYYYLNCYIFRYTTIFRQNYIC
jgi:hypothetical protein